MWMRSCAICKALMKKLRLSDSVPVSAGGNGRAIRIETLACKPVNSMRESLGEKAGLTVAKVIEFYIPTNFRKSVKWGSPEQRGKIIEFAPQVKKSA
jgi:hypothetical protein